MNLNMRNLLLLTTVVSLSLLTGCSKQSDTSLPSVKAAGGIDSSGGNSIKSTETQIKAALVEVKQNMRVAFHRMSIIMKETTDPVFTNGYFPDGGTVSLVDGSYNGIANDYFQKLLVGVKTQEDPQATIERLSFQFSNADCSSREGDREASVKDTGEICLSLPRLLQLPPEALKLQLNALIFHEIAHVRGTDLDEIKDESNAVALQQWFITAQQTILRQSETVKDASGNYVKDNYTELIFSNVYNGFDEMQENYQYLEDDVQKNLLSPEQICPTIYKLLVSSPVALKKSLSFSGLQLPRQITFPLYDFLFLPIELLKSPQLSCPDVTVVDTNSSSQEKSKLAPIQSNAKFRTELMTALLVYSKRLAQIRHSIQDFQMIQAPKSNFPSWNSQRITNIALLPFYENGQIYGDAWLKKTPYTDIDQVECKITNLKSNSSQFFQPKNTESIRVSDGPNKFYGAFENKFSFALPHSDGQDENITLSFTKHFYGQLSNGALLKAPQLDFKASSNLASTSISSQEMANAFVDEKGASAVLQKGSIESFSFTFKTRSNTPDVDISENESASFEIRCGMKPVELGPIKSNMLF